MHAASTMSNPADTISENYHRGSDRLVIALIPAHNEERFIGSLVLAALAYVDKVVVVDDGSHDRTAEIARRAGGYVLRQPVNQGKAAAVSVGFSYVRQLNPAAVVMLDGDGQHRTDDIPAVLDPVLSGSADMVIGSRFLEVRSVIPAYRQVGQHGLTVVTNIASGMPVGDSQSGFRAFSAAALQYISFSQSGFSIESEMQFLAREHGLRVVEVPIKVIYAEPAKRNPFQHGMQVIQGVMRLVSQARPLLFFGGAGLALLTAGIVLGLSVAHTFITTRQLAVGQGLITEILCVVGVVLFFAGVILHSTRAMLLDLQRGLYERLAVYEPAPTVEEGTTEPDRAIDLGSRP
jgi:Glycosyl transferase family 2